MSTNSCLVNFYNYDKFPIYAKFVKRHIRQYYFRVPSNAHNFSVCSPKTIEKIQPRYTIQFYDQNFSCVFRLYNDHSYTDNLQKHRLPFWAVYYQVIIGSSDEISRCANSRKKMPLDKIYLGDQSENQSECENYDSDDSNADSDDSHVSGDWYYEGDDYGPLNINNEEDDDDDNADNNDESDSDSDLGMNYNDSEAEEAENSGTLNDSGNDCNSQTSKSEYVFIDKTTSPGMIKRKINKNILASSDSETDNNDDNKNGDDGKKRYGKKVKRSTVSKIYDSDESDSAETVRNLKLKCTESLPKTTTPASDGSVISVTPIDDELVNSQISESSTAKVSENDDL